MYRILSSIYTRQLNHVFNYTLFKIFFSSHKFGFGEGASKFLGGASKFSNLLAPRATASTSLISRPGKIRIRCQTLNPLHHTNICKMDVIGLE